MKILDIAHVKIPICACRPAPQQLLSRGLFGCTPTAPTLAVDLNVLDFAAELYVRVAPNMSAWSDALEAFLNRRQFKLRTAVS